MSEEFDLEEHEREEFDRALKARVHEWARARGKYTLADWELRWLLWSKYERRAFDYLSPSLRGENATLFGLPLEHEWRP